MSNPYSCSQLTICITAYNEESNVPALIEDLDRVRDAHPEVRVVIRDNCSQDATYSQCCEFANSRKWMSSSHPTPFANARRIERAEFCSSSKSQQPLCAIISTRLRIPTKGHLELQKVGCPCQRWAIYDPKCPGPYLLLLLHLDYI